MKGREFSEWEIEDYINQEEDYYIRSAYQKLLDKTKSFYKKYNMRSITDFIHNQKITKIIVMGHSYRIDIPYFEYLSGKYADAKWELYWYNELDKQAAWELAYHLNLEYRCFR